ncbi:cupin domain-containing protein [Erwinia sp. V71]|uniref:cupin domain-containing protein n=1 Tax=Erwinia sp. V71 TaxID=3369424 RepID=UPI003F619D00
MKPRHPPVQPESSRMVQTEDDAFWLSQESHSAGTQIVRHCHPDFVQLIFIVSGCACFCFDDRLIIAGQGSAVFIPAGVAHSIEMPRQTRLRAIAIFSPQTLVLAEHPCQLEVSPLLEALSVAVSDFPRQKPATAAEQRSSGCGWCLSISWPVRRSAPRPSLLPQSHACAGRLPC